MVDQNMEWLEQVQLFGNTYFGTESWYYWCNWWCDHWRIDHRNLWCCLYYISWGECSNSVVTTGAFVKGKSIVLSAKVKNMVSIYIIASTSVVDDRLIFWMEMFSRYHLKMTFVLAHSIPLQLWRCKLLHVYMISQVQWEPEEEENDDEDDVLFDASDTEDLND